MYLCSVRVVRAHGYQVREQDFAPEKGTLVAARSTPDPKATVMTPGFFRRTKEVVWNAWEHSKFEFWDDDDAIRQRTDERIVIKFRQGSGSLWGWMTHHPRTQTKVTVSADVTEYGKDDWVIRRDDKPDAVRDAIFQSIADCVRAPSPSVYTAKIKAAAPSTSPAQPVVVSAAPTAAPVSATLSVAPDVASATPVVPVAAQPAVVPAADPAETLMEARKLYESGKFKDAVPKLASVVAAEPDNAEALGYLGASYYQLKKLDDAIATYEAYVKLVPSDTRTQEFIEEMKKERTTNR